MSQSQQLTVPARIARMICLAGGLGIALIAALPAPARAVEPTRQTVVQQGVHSTAPCPSGVVLQGLFDITRDITTYYDQAGTPVRRLSVNRAEGTWTNPNTGAWLAAEVVRQVQTDLTTGESFSTGSSSRTFLPGGGGVAIGAAGLQVFDAAGQLVAHYGPDSDSERAQLCAALGP
jgi:hypothetical protein